MHRTTTGRWVGTKSRVEFRSVPHYYGQNHDRLNSHSPDYSRSNLLENYNELDLAADKISMNRICIYEAAGDWVWVYTKSHWAGPGYVQCCIWPVVSAYKTTMGRIWKYRITIGRIHRDIITTIDICMNVCISYSIWICVCSKQQLYEGDANIEGLCTGLLPTHYAERSWRCI